MSLLDRILSFLGIGMKIHFHAEDQDDGYTFIRSPELRGFTLMLEHEQTKNIATLMNAIHDPFISYMMAFCRARNKAMAKDHLKMKNFSETANHSYTARLCSFRVGTIVMNDYLINPQ
jgi:hypothetical protein